MIIWRIPAVDHERRLNSPALALVGFDLQVDHDDEHQLTGAVKAKATPQEPARVDRSPRMVWSGSVTPVRCPCAWARFSISPG